MHVVYTVDTLMIYVLVDKAPLLSQILHDGFMVVGYGSFLSILACLNVLHTLDGVTGVYEGVVTHTQGCEDIYGQVDNPVMDFDVLSCDGTEFFAVGCISDGKI